MTRRVLTDEIWSQLLATMTAKCCYDAKNGREVMEAILWKLRTGAQWRDAYFSREQPAQTESKVCTDSLVSKNPSILKQNKFETEKDVLEDSLTG